MNGNASVERSRSGATAASTSRDRGPVSDSPTSPRPSTSNRTEPSRWQVVPEPARVVGLGRQRAEQVELVRLATRARP